ncbi:MAG: Ig-like domain-containing protein [bacterium]
MSTLTRLASSLGIVCVSSCSADEISVRSETSGVAVDRIVVTPGRSSLAVGSAQTFLATISDANGNVLTDRIVSWSSSAPNVATVSSTGVVTAVSESGSLSATATIVARAGGKIGSATATVQDPTVPILTSFTLSPSTITPASAPVMVTASVHVTDASGALGGSVSLNPPPGNSALLAKSCDFRLTDGSAADGTWSCSMTFVAGVPAGRWSLLNYRMSNAAANEASFSGTAAKAFGVSSGVSVLENAADMDSPVLAGFTILPSSTVVAATGGTTVLTVHATDAVSGIYSVGVDIGNQYGLMNGNAARCSQLEANPDRSDVTWSCTLTYSGNVLVGLYPVLSIELLDRAGNSRTYTNAELLQAGFPAMFTLTR